MKTLIGYAVGWNDTPATKFSSSGYIESRADVTLGLEVFKERKHAEIVLAAERLKNPSMDWIIVEIHRSK